MHKFYEIKQSADKPKVLELYIYSDVKADAYDWWTDKKIESDTSAAHFQKELAAAGNVEQINIYINSLGGSVMEGVAIYNQLRRHPAMKTVYIDGFACSVASVIAMAGDKVIMPANTTMMVHAPWMYVAGNATELRKYADDLDKLTESSLQAYVQKAKGKLTAEKMAELFAAETYLTAAECIAYGLADEYAAADIDIEAAYSALEQENQKGAKQLSEIVKKLAKQKAPNPGSITPPPDDAEKVQKEKEAAEQEQAAKAEQARKAAEFSQHTENFINKFFGV